MIHDFLAIQFFTDVDECTHNLHSCAPNMKCVNEYGSFFCKGLPNIHVYNIQMSLLPCLLLKSSDRFLDLEWNCQPLSALHGFIKFSIV